VFLYPAIANFTDIAFPTDNTDTIYKTTLDALIIAVFDYDRLVILFIVFNAE
jgi:hypothetical protein